MVTKNLELVIEIIKEDDSLWFGNQIYKNEDSGAFAKFCAEQDYTETYQAPEDIPGEYTWDFISKGTYFMYEDGTPTGVQMRWRDVNSLDSEI